MASERPVSLKAFGLRPLGLLGVMLLVSCA